MKVPGSFVPAEDQGYVVTIVVMPDGATLSRTTKTTEAIRSAIAQDPAVAHEFAVNGLELLTGANKTNAATMFVRLKDWSLRETSADQIVDKLFGIGMSQPDGLAFAVNPPAIRGLGTAAGFEVYVQSQRDTDPIKLAAVMNNLMEAMGKDLSLTPPKTYRAAIAYRSGRSQSHLARGAHCRYLHHLAKHHGLVLRQRFQ
jgi:multidrug efflux pump